MHLLCGPTFNVQIMVISAVIYVSKVFSKLGLVFAVNGRSNEEDGDNV